MNKTKAKQYSLNKTIIITLFILLTGISFLFCTRNTFNPKAEDIIAELKKSNNNKVIYIDIIATWCAPCINELKHSKALHKSLDNVDVVFVYLFAKSDSIQWLNLSKEYSLDDHINIFLTEQQYNYMISEYNIAASFPQYVLVDKFGNVFGSVYRPSQKKEIMQEIKNML
jgi:thiol-disulfide isomerase/thioredoxin